MKKRLSDDMSFSSVTGEMTSSTRFPLGLASAPFTNTHSGAWIETVELFTVVRQLT
jgi:hypothetical protein